LLETDQARAMVETAQERGYLEPAELEAFAIELDLNDEEVEELTAELEKKGLEISTPAAAAAAEAEKEKEKEAELAAAEAAASASGGTRRRCGRRCTSASIGRCCDLYGLRCGPSRTSGWRCCSAR